VSLLPRNAKCFAADAQKHLDEEMEAMENRINASAAGQEP